MLRPIAIIVIAGLLTGCASKDGLFVSPNVPNTCTSTGWTATTILYGDSHIAVIPMSEIVAGAELRFILVPIDASTDVVAYANVNVEVKARAPDNSWFPPTSGSKNTGDGTIRICVDPTLPVGHELKYDVQVDGVGILDPRAEIIIRPE